MKFETWFLLGSLFVSTIEAHCTISQNSKGHIWPTTNDSKIFGRGSMSTKPNFHDGNTCGEQGISDVLYRPKGLTVTSDVAWTPGYVIEPENPQGKANPLYDLFSTDFTCGRDAFASAAKTETADVIAGTQVGFRVDRGVTDENDHYVRLNPISPHSLLSSEWLTGNLCLR